jgi:outer membrane assembly lipoprotein YfiO
MRSPWLIGWAVFAACYGGPPPRSSMRDPGAELALARTEFRHGNFSDALVAFRRAQFDLNPAQVEMAEVRYLVAECDFQLGDLTAAGLEFRKVADEFPSSAYAPLALLRAGDANLRLWRRPELDPTPGQTALATYQELAGRYPGTDAAARAQMHVGQLNAWFAEKDYKNGLFYYRRKAYDSAIIYFKDIIANYPNTRTVSDALERLVDSYRAIGYATELKEACASLRQYYPATRGLDRTCPPSASPGAQ